MMQRIAVIDYGMGNLRSVSKAIEYVAPNDEVLVSRDKDIIANADRIVCPGQGAAKDCMAALTETGLDTVIKETIDTRPFLGICMGMQVLLRGSDENEGIDCLNLIPGHAVRFRDPLTDSVDNARLKVPHMGWNEVLQERTHYMWSEIPDNSRFYFAHSYYCVPDNDQVTVGRCNYGDEITVAVAHASYFACQFHPEKSGQMGLQLLRNFVRWNGLD